MKKVLCLFISLLIIVLSVPMMSDAAEIDQYNINKKLHWTQIPIVSQKLLDTQQVSIGGEGCQWPLAISASNDGSIILLGTDVGGIYRSIDSGKTYAPQNVGLKCKGGSAFAIDPNNNDRILLVGVGSKFFNMNGIYLSTDKGSTWSHKLQDKLDGTRDIRDSVAFDPQSYDETVGGSAVAYYSNYYNNPDKQDLSVMGIYKTVDGGNTWNLINNELYNAIIKVGSDSTVYAATDSKLFSSCDGAATWTECYSGEITGFDLVKNTHGESDKLVISDKTGIAVSYDGVSFTKNDAATYPTAATVPGLEGYAQNVMISPADSDYMLVCYVRSNNFNNVNYYTHDSGETWYKSVLSNDYTMLGVTGGRICTFAWTGNDKNTVYSFGGDIITSSHDGGARFDWDCNGYCGILVGGEFHFNVYDSDIVYFGSQDYNGAVTVDGGKSWKYVNFSGYGWGGNSYGGYAADENTYFVGVSPSWDGDREICITYDGGKTIIHTGVKYSVTDGVLHRGAESAYQSPTDPNVFFQTFFRSPDGGRTWLKMDGCTGVFCNNIDTGRLFGTDITRHYVVYSDDEGVTWQNYNTEPIGTNYCIGDISVDSKNDIVYVAYGGKCIGKLNPDGTWKCILSKEMNNAPLNDRSTLVINCVSVDPNHPEVLYCGGSGDYYMNTSSTLRSTDGGETWQCVTPNNTYSIIGSDSLQCGFETCSLSVDPETSELWAAGGCLGFAKLSAPCNGCDEHYAVKRKTLDVTYVSDSTVFQRDTVGFGLKVKQTESVPTKNGKVFDAWCSDSNCTKEYDFSRRTDSSLTLYARFVDELKVTFKSGDVTTAVNVGRGHKVESPEAPKYDGLYFAGWFTERDFKNKFCEDIPIEDNMTLYAGYYRNIYDSTVKDYNAYIANSSHAITSSYMINDDAQVSNRVTRCVVEENKTYGVAIDMDCRFRFGAVQKVKVNEEITNYYQDPADKNTMAYVGGTKTAEITTGEAETILLIFYWTSYSGCTDFLKTRQSIAVYDPQIIIAPPQTQEETTETTAETTTETTTEATTEATEPTTQPASRIEDDSSGCSCLCHKDGFYQFVYQIVRFFWKLFSTNHYCYCGKAHW